MNSDNEQELLPLVDEQGQVLGSVSREECHCGAKPLHPVVHLHLFNSAGELYLQRRPAWKKIQPSKWDTAMGGHVDFGEDVQDALLREAMEELGVEDFEPRFLCKYVFESPIEKELVYIFTCVYDGELAPSEELDGGRFWTKEEILSSLGTGVFTPNFESEYQKYIMD